MVNETQLCYNISVKSSLILVKLKKLNDVNKVQLTTKLEPPSDDVNHKKMRANQRAKTKQYPDPSKKKRRCSYAVLRARKITAAADFDMF